MESEESDWSLRKEQQGYFECIRTSALKGVTIFINFWGNKNQARHLMINIYTFLGRRRGQKRRKISSPNVGGPTSQQTPLKTMTSAHQQSYLAAWANKTQQPHQSLQIVQHLQPSMVTGYSRRAKNAAKMFHHSKDEEFEEDTEDDDSDYEETEDDEFDPEAEDDEFDEETEDDEFDDKTEDDEFDEEETNQLLEESSGHQNKKINRRSQTKGQPSIVAGTKFILKAW